MLIYPNNCLTFLMPSMNVSISASVLDKLGIAVRTGHHCAQPIMERFNIPGTVRASFAVYNTEAEIDTFIEGIKKVKQLFG
jgi:cysteine desulfurase/selenocysteine lyase